MARYESFIRARCAINPKEGVSFNCTGESLVVFKFRRPIAVDRAKRFIRSECPNCPLNNICQVYNLANATEKDLESLTSLDVESSEPV